MIKYLATVGFCLMVFGAWGQTFTSVQDGDWDDPNTWGVASFPTSSNSSQITVNHTVTVTNNLTIDQTTVNGSILVNDAVVLTIANGAGTDITMNGSIVVTGTLVLSNGSTHAGMTASTASFEANSIYQHLFTTAEGVIPDATWDPASTVQILGYTTFNAATAGGNWDQNFGNVTWNCTAQTSSLNLNGLFALSANGGLEGDFRVNSTGTGVIQLSNGQSVSMEIANSLFIAGTSRVHFTVTGVVTLDLGGSFVFTSTNTTGSELADNTGSCTIDIAGDFSMNGTNGDLDCSDNANGSGILNISGNFELLAGTLQETGGGTAQGNINFVGTDATHTFTNSGTINNLINYSIAATNTVIVSGESRMRGVGGTLTVNGILRVESTAANGAIQTGNTNAAGTGNVRTSTRVYNSGSEVIYGGTSAQVIGNGQPATAGVTTTIDNTAGVSLNNTSSATVTIGGDLIVLAGNLTVVNDNLTVNGNIDLQGGDLIFTTTTTARTVTSNGDFILSGGDLISTSGTANASLVINDDVTGGNLMSFTGANSNLTINGTGALSVDFPISTATTFENITINRTGGGAVVFPAGLNVTTLFTLTSGDLTVDGNMTVNTLNMNGGDLTMNGDLTATDISATSGDILMFGTLLLTDDLNMATGTTLFFEGQTVELRSQFNNNLTGGVFFADGASTLNITNTGTLGTLIFDASGNTLGSFSLNRPTGGTLVTLNSSLTVDNAFSLTDGGFLNTSGLDLGSGALLTRNSAASFVAPSAIPTGGPYDLILNGAGMTTGVEAQGNLSDVTSNSTGTVTLAFPMAASGNFQINSGAFTCGVNAVSASAFVNVGTFTAPSSTLTLTGNLTNSGTYNRNNGTVSFDGTSSILGSTNPSFQNIIINGTLTPPTTLNLNGAFTNNGTFNNAGSGTVAFLGTAAVTQVVSGTAITDFNNITVTNTTANPDVSLNSSQNLTGVLTLAATAIFDADGAGAAVFTLLSTADDVTADASIATLPGSAQVTGNVTVQRFMSIEGPNNTRIYRNISSPVQNAQVADIQNEIPITGSFTGTSSCSGCGTNQSMFSYNESVITGGANGGYVDFPDAVNTETLVPGRGYALFERGNILSSGLWDVRGPINFGTISLGNPTGITFTSSGVVADDGWNLVGNPFPSTIDWNAASGWVKPAALDATIYYRDNGNDPQQYATWNGVTGTNGGSPFIATGQAFFVKLNSTPSPVTLSANESVKVAGTQTSFFRVSSTDNLLRITLKQGSKSDEAVVHFREDATSGFDSQADAWKLPSTSLNLSTVSGGNKLAINSLSQYSCDSSIPLDISTVTPGSYTLEFTGVNSFTGTVSISLIDNFLSQTTNLVSNPVYSFQVTSDVNSYGSGRFELVLTTAAYEQAAISQIGGNVLQSNYASGNQWYFNNEVIPDATGMELVVDKSGVYRLEVTVSGLCKTGAELPLELPLVITGGEEIVSNGFSVYPNPVKDNLQITLSSEFDDTVVLIDSYGRNLSRIELSASDENRTSSFDARNLPQGFYYIKATKSGRPMFVKIIKQ